MIALSPSTVAVLRKHREKQEATKIMLGTQPTDEDLVFCQIDGSPLLPDTVSHAWVKCAKRVGLDGIRLHDARHTHASLMLKAGTHPKVVQERLGHASIQTTLDTYSHVAPGLQEAAADHFDKMVSSKRGNEARGKIG
jgi:integrase